MSASQPTVHPMAVDLPVLPDLVEQPPPPPGLRMHDLPGVPGTLGGLGLRLTQFVLALISLSVMCSTKEFPSYAAFCYLVAAAVVQCLWSAVLAMLDVYALLARRRLRNRQAVFVFTIGDGIAAVLTFSAACGAAGITTVLDDGYELCGADGCSRFMISAAMALLSWFALSPSFIFNFCSID